MKNLPVKNLFVALSIYLIIGQTIKAQIGTDDKFILKSEMSKMNLGKFNDNNYDFNHSLIVARPHMPVLISTDTKAKHLKIELNQPDNDHLSIIFSDTHNNKIFTRNCKCKDHIKIDLNKIKCDTFKVNIYHIEGGYLLASQEIRKR